MRLATLKLSGFKSFARTTTLEFPAAISAIVGPNGSGKSNVAEAVRWVLGEQSLKTLRGKRGEDLIFSGSTSAPRMGKAAVALTFDNRDHAIPLDYEEVRLERKIFRDGTNEYSLNGSQVRLKDIVELLARVGLGQTHHNIIGQGEVDRSLLASPRERRELLEEAIGLRIWQLKKREAERKLEATAENIKQASALIQEIAPHLKFLKSQADKAERREAIRKELEDCYRAYVQGELLALQTAEIRLSEMSSPIEAALERREQEIADLKKSIAGAEARNGSAEAIGNTEQALERLEARRGELERALGRIEGRLEAARPGPRRGGRIHVADIGAAVQPIIEELSAATALGELETLQGALRSAAERLRRMLAGFKAGARRWTDDAGERLTQERNRISSELAALGKELANVRQELDGEIRAVHRAQAGLKELFERLREREDQANALRRDLERVRFEREKLALRRQDLERVIAESGLARRDLEGVESPFSGLEPEELKKKTERLRARIEEIGGIDDSVLKEYRDTKARHDFLAGELEDLERAGRDLKKLIAELEERIERDFREGFAKIKSEFHHYFRIIFGGGKGVLAYAPLRKAAAEEAAEDEANDREGTEAEYGVDIDVDLPKKRTKGLAMLSGGERALVSIALLFAITAVNPPPFLVLDETDAALDEANSRKYAAILKELSAKTQLILITHNRETIQQACILYGVTMGEDGISKILSLKLEEAESYGNR